MAEEFDPTPYVRPPMIDVASGVTLGVSLLTAMPRPAPEHVRAAATKLRRDTLALQAAWGKSASGGIPVDRRRADAFIDNAWGNLLDRLESYARLSRDNHPRAARARVLVDTISAGDREWLNFAYQAEWAESTRRLQRIADEGLEPEINQLAGPEFLSEVKAAHAAYGIALGVTKPARVAAEVNLAEPLRTLARSVARYSLAVVTMASEDVESLAVVRKALRPIDDFREGQARRLGRAAGEESDPAPQPPAGPTTPVPEVK